MGRADKQLAVGIRHLTGRSEVGITLLSCPSFSLPFKKNSQSAIHGREGGKGQRRLRAKKIAWWITLRRGNRPPVFEQSAHQFGTESVASTTRKTVAETVFLAAQDEPFSHGIECRMRFGTASARRRCAATRDCSAAEVPIGLRPACQTGSPAWQATRGSSFVTIPQSALLPRCN